MSSIKAMVILAVVATTSGCASITSDSHQPVSVSASKDGQLVEKAKCSLKNDKGSWEVDTPGVVAVHRSSEDLIVTCKKAELPDGIARGISRAAGGMWGNIVFGGGVGALIDHSSGKGYNYPNDLPIKMGESLVYDQAKEGKPTRQNSTPPASAASTTPTQKTSATSLAEVKPSEHK